MYQHRSRFMNHNVNTSYTDAKSKEKAHRYKQKVEKCYILAQLIQKEKAKQNEKVQEVC